MQPNTTVVDFGKRFRLHIDFKHNRQSSTKHEHVKERKRLQDPNSSGLILRKPSSTIRDYNKIEGHQRKSRRMQATFLQSTTAASNSRAQMISSQLEMQLLSVALACRTWTLSCLLHKVSLGFAKTRARPGSYYGGR
jgi:hypothetical protein